MSATSRIWLTAGFLGMALAAQTGLLLHMAYGPANSYEPLRKPLADLPVEISNSRGEVVWQFEKTGMESLLPRMPFEPLDVYFRRGAGPADVQFETYIVHSKNGEDRKHHPEICVRDVQKLPEIESARAVVKLNGDEAKPVQRFCFRRGPDQEVTTYYWHYTFEPLPQGDQTWLQALHQTLSRSPPSVTVQVTTTAGPDRCAEIERTLLPELDRALRSEHLPKSVRMGCDRLPIALETR